MKLYIMNCGQMITPDGNILAAFNTEQLRLVIPVPAYLIEHPTEGLVLIDCGFDYNHLPDEMKYGIAASPLQRLTRQIERLGYRSEDVRHVVISHLHFDHAGQMRDFPKATFHMRESEWSMLLNCTPLRTAPSTLHPVCLMLSTASLISCCLPLW